MPGKRKGGQRKKKGVNSAERGCDCPLPAAKTVGKWETGKEKKKGREGQPVFLPLEIETNGCLRATKMKKETKKERAARLVRQERGSLGVWGGRQGRKKGKKAGGGCGPKKKTTAGNRLYGGCPNLGKRRRGKTVTPSYMRKKKGGGRRRTRISCRPGGGRGLQERSGGKEDGLSYNQKKGNYHFFSRRLRVAQGKGGRKKSSATFANYPQPFTKKKKKGNTLVDFRAKRRDRLPTYSTTGKGN